MTIYNIANIASYNAQFLQKHCYPMEIKVLLVSMHFIPILQVRYITYYSSMFYVLLGIMYNVYRYSGSLNQYDVFVSCTGFNRKKL